MIHSRSICGMYLDGIVSSQPHARQLLVGEMLNHFQQARIASKQILAEVGSALDEVFLILPVTDFAQSAHQQSVTIVLDQRVPIGSPNDFNDIPSCAAENRFQLLNDFSIPADWPIQPLQVAVHYEDQVVELFARAQRDRAK